jgi:hypothetical protein
MSSSEEMVEIRIMVFLPEELNLLFKRYIAMKVSSLHGKNSFF